MNPLVSIIIPVYNGSNYLHEAIDSALAQTYKNCEILVINDGSNDNDKTEKIAISYGNKIRYFKKNNGGVATALNMAIENMHGEYFSWLSHDDLYSPNKISIQLESLSKLKDKTILITCGFIRINKKGELLSCDKAENFTDDELCTPLFPLLKGIAQGGGLIFGCSLLIHKSHFDRVGKFNAELLINDIDLWFRMMRNQPLIYIRDQLAYKRIHDDQDSISKSNIYIPAFNDFFLNILYKLTDNELIQVFGSKLKAYEEIENTFYGAEVALYASVKAAEERLLICRNAKTLEDKNVILYSDSILSKERHEKSIKILQKKHETTIKALNEQYESIIRTIQRNYESTIDEIKQVYESSTSWKLTKPLRIIKHFIERKICKKLP